MKLNEKIVSLRKKEGISQEELATKLNVTRQTISNWELAQTTPDISQAKELSAIFNVSIDELTDNHIEINCKDNTDNLLYNLIGKRCFILTDYEKGTDFRIIETTPLEVLEVSDRFLKVKFNSNKKDIIKLIDIDLILSIKVVEEVV